MKETPDLDALYEEAQAAIAARDDARASDLLQRIVVADETYRDAARLLSTIVARRKRRWYGNPWLWAAVGAVVLVAGGILAARLLPLPTPEPSPAPATEHPLPTETPAPLTATPAPPTPTSGPTPTPIPLAWKRLAPGETFAYDTVTAIAVDPSDPDVWYVGTENAGVFKSIDGGISWLPANRGLPGGAIWTLVMDPGDPQTLYTGVPAGGFFKTTDGGQSWQPINDGIDLDLNNPLNPLRIVSVDPRDGQHLLCSPGLEGGLHESTDGGTSWSPVQASACPDAFIALAFHPTDGEVLFATACGPFGGSCERGFYTSRDRGRTWALAGQIPPETCTAVGSLEVDRQSGDLLYVHAGGLTYGSLDGGESWSLIEDLWCTALVVDPGEGAVAYCASEEQVLKTADGGQTWEPIASPGWSSPQTMAVSPHDPDVLLVGGKGCYLSTDSGETWEERSGGLGAARSELMLDPAGGATLYVEDASTRWLYRSGDGGQSWTLIDDGGLGLAFDAAGDVLYRLQGEMVARSGDDGATWEPLATVTTVTTGWIETIVAHPIQPRTLYAGSVFFEERWRWRLHASTDGGVSWRSDEFDHNIGRLFFDHQEGVILYAIRGLDAHRSTDGGTTWAPCGETGAFHSLEASGASVDPTDGDRLMVATQGDGVLLTEDGCNNWTQSNEGLGSLYVNSVAIDPRDARRVYAGTQDAGAHVSFDGGRQWGPVNEGLLGALTVYSIAVDPQGKVYAATPYGVFWLEGQ